MVTDINAFIILNILIHTGTDVLYTPVRRKVNRIESTVRVMESTHSLGIQD